MIFTVARASPMVRTTSFIRRFSAANTCSTRLRTRARCVAMGYMRRHWLAAWLGTPELRHQPPLSEQRQIGLVVIGGVCEIEHAGELASLRLRAVSVSSSAIVDPDDGH